MEADSLNKDCIIYMSEVLKFTLRLSRKYRFRHTMPIIYQLYKVYAIFHRSIASAHRNIIDKISV